MWLAPVQAKVLTISEGSRAYGEKVHQRLLQAGIRSELDDRDDKISYKIRAASKEKPPYILGVGGQEAEKGTVNIRARENPDAKEELPLEVFIDRIRVEAQKEF